MKFYNSTIKEMIAQKMEKTGLIKNNYELIDFTIDYYYEKIFLYFASKTLPEYHPLWHQRDFIRLGQYQEYEKLKNQDSKTWLENQEIEKKNQENNKENEEAEKMKFRYVRIKEMIAQKMEKTGLSKDNYESIDFVVDYDYQKIFLYFASKTLPKDHILRNKKDFISFKEYQEYENFKNQEWKLKDQEDEVIEQVEEEVSSM